MAKLAFIRQRAGIFGAGGVLVSFVAVPSAFEAQVGGLDRDAGMFAKNFEQNPRALIRGKLLDGSNKLGKWTLCHVHFVASLQLARRQQST